MQSGRGKNKKWCLEYNLKQSFQNPLMNWEKSTETMNSVKLHFETKEKAIMYAKKNNINFDVIEPNKRSYIIKSYSDNFIK